MILIESLFRISLFIKLFIIWKGCIRLYIFWMECITELLIWLSFCGNKGYRIIV